MITYGDYLINSGHYDITPEQEREIEARAECERRGIDPDELCADGGVEAWMVVANDLLAALRNIAEGNLGDAPWQADYEAIRAVARAAISKAEGEHQ